jgi:capsular exopolysaccharide synthesis family protein
MNIQRSYNSDNLSAAAPGSEAGEDAGLGISMADLLRIVHVRRKLIAAVAFTVIAIATVLVVQATPLYSATALVMLDQRKNTVEDTAAALSGLPSDPATVQNQVQILTSNELAERVIDKLHLADDPEFNPRAAGWTNFLRYLNPLTWIPGSVSDKSAAVQKDLERDDLQKRFQSRLAVEPVGFSTAISVTYTAETPVKARDIANAVANAYVEDQLEAKFEATQKATQWLSGRIAELSKKAQQADSAVQRYKAEHNITTTANGVSVVDQQTADINGQLVIAKTQLAEKQAAYSSLVGLARTGRAADSAAAMSSPLIATLRGQESDIARQLADLSSRYLPRHPKILDLQAQKANIDQKIAEELQRIVDAARNDVSIASAHVGSLQSSLGQLEGQGATQNQAAVELTALQSAATSARSMYEAFLGRLNQTQGQEGIQTPDARVISQAQIPRGASFPRKGLTIGLSIPAGILLGLMIAFAIERLDSGFRTTSQLENMLGVPVLATIPEIREEGIPAADFVADKPLSSFAEAIRGVQLGLSLSNVDRQPKVIVVTSSVPGEGKTTVSISLARMAARGGLKTIIIDGDLRRPNLANNFGREHFERGLIEAITGELPLDQCVAKDPKSNAVILPCLKPAVNPADVLSSQTMQRLIDNLSKTFDLVIIDSAPILPVNDTKILSRLADTVLFVVRWEKTPREAVATALRSLRDVHATISGVAMTRADTERFRYYNYGYQSYYSYNKYYSG